MRDWLFGISKREYQISESLALLGHALYDFRNGSFDLDYAIILLLRVAERVDLRASLKWCADVERAIVNQHDPMIII